jgi:hypothetical protein
MKWTRLVFTREGSYRGVVLFIVLYKWLFARIHGFVSKRRWDREREGSWKHTSAIILAACTILGRTLSLANLLLFLKMGNYRTFGERIADLRVKVRPFKNCSDEFAASQHFGATTFKPTGENLDGVINYENLTRQLIWKRLSDFSLFSLALIDFT